MHVYMHLPLLFCATSCPQITATPALMVLSASLHRQPDASSVTWLLPDPGRHNAAIDLTYWQNGCYLFCVCLIRWFLGSC